MMQASKALFLALLLLDDEIQNFNRCKVLFALAICPCKHFATIKLPNLVQEPVLDPTNQMPGEIFAMDLDGVPQNLEIRKFQLRSTFDMVISFESIDLPEVP
jgi:hypothetical protein